MNDNIYCIGLTKETCYQALGELRQFFEYQHRKGLGSIALYRINNQIKEALLREDQSFQ